VNVFDSSGEFVGELRDSRGKPLVIDGLWTLTLGGGAKSSPDTVYFTAGPNGETDRGISTMKRELAALKGVAPNTDPVLQNAWGVAFTPAGSLRRLCRYAFRYPAESFPLQTANRIRIGAAAPLACVLLIG
jgi:hypothetical protein